MTLRTRALERFREWFDAAGECAAIEDATAMTLATVGVSGQPAARTVLLKAFDERGFVFYTNKHSRKGEHLTANPRAALCFHWAPLGRQILVEGDVEDVSDAEADAYFESRPRLSRIGACASEQSRPLDEPETLARRVEALQAEYGDGPIPRPPYWSGYRVLPTLLEFWHAGDGRLHRRERYVHDGNGQWVHYFVNP